jgi:hypothetical protein
MAEPNEFELKLDAEEVSLSQLVSASSIFAALLREVSREYTGAERAVKWVVRVEPGSVKLPVRGRPTSDKVAAAAVPEIVAAIVGGLKTLSERPARPPFFNDQALREAKALANLTNDDLPGIAVKNGTVGMETSKQLMTHVDEVLGAGRESIGTIEGKLEALNIHEKPQRFGIFDLLTDQRVDCYFGANVDLEQVLRGVGRRVAVSGIIKTRGTGERFSIDVRGLRVFPAEAELPSPDDVRGILRPRRRSA